MGSLARAAEDDPDWPEHGDFETYREHLEEIGATPELETSLQQVWEEYRSQRQ